MKIRIGSQNDTSALKKIWLDTFSDSKQFVDWNFENNYSPENVMLCEAEGKIASCLHLIPYTLSMDGRELNAAYISAVATPPEFQHRGYASELIKAAILHIKKSGADAAFLSPAISDFYERFGFSSLLEKAVIHFESSDFSSLNADFKTPLVSEALDIYLKCCINKRFYLKRTERDMFLITDDLLKNTGGDLKLLSDSSGYVMYKECENFTELYEIMAETPCAKRSLMSYLSSFKKPIIQNLPPIMFKALSHETDLADNITAKNAYFNLIL